MASFDSSKYKKYAEQNFGGFTEYNPPDASYYQKLGYKIYQAKEAEKKAKEKAKKQSESKEVKEIRAQQSKAKSQGRGGAMPDYNQLKKEKEIQDEYELTGRFPKDIRKMIDNLNFEEADRKNAEYAASKKEPTLAERLGSLFKGGGGAVGQVAKDIVNPESYKDLGKDLSSLAKKATDVKTYKDLGESFSDGKKAVSNKENYKGFGTDLIEGLQDAFQTKVLKQNPQKVAANSVREYAEKGQRPSKATEELARSATRGVNSATLGMVKEQGKRVDNEGLNKMFEPRKGAGGVTDFLSDSAGYLVPGLGALKALRGTKLGADMSKKGVQKALQLGKEGAAIGAGMGATEAVIREGANGEDYSGKDNAYLFGLSTLLGAVADPAIYGVGKGASKAISKTVQGEVPTFSGGASNDVLERLAPLMKNNTLNQNTTSLEMNPAFNALRNKPPQPLDQFLGRIKKDSPIMQQGRKLNYTEREMPDFSYGRQTSEPKNQSIVGQHFGIETPRDLVDSAPQSYWKGRYEDFQEHVTSNYDQNRLSKEALEDLWTQFAKPEESVTLDELADLAYKGYEEPKVLDAETAWSNMGNRPPVSNNAKKIMGINNDGDDLMSRLQRNGLVANKEAAAASPVIQEAPTSTALSPEVQEINARIETLESIIRDNPDGEVSVRPIINALEEEKNAFSPQDNTLKTSENIVGSQQDGLLERLKRSGLVAPKRNAANEFEAIASNEQALVREGESEGLASINNGLDFSKLKDINGLQGYMSDIYRNTRDVFGEDFPTVKKAILDPFDKSKKEYVEMQEQWLNTLETDIVKGLGIKKGSELSKLVQDYGEKTISLEQLKQAEPKNWEKVVDADKWFRNAYDQLIDQVNASRAVVYPNNPERLVPKRDDYYRHFRELDGLEGLRNMFDTPAGINPELVGTSDFTNPSSKWAGFMQKRGLGPYKSDAVGGFLNYLPSASYATKIDPNIPVFKEFSKSLKEGSGSTKNINHYIEFLEDFSRDLAGKTNFLDRPVQKIIGRKAFTGLQWLNNRVKKNAVLGNLGSTLAQIANVPNGIAFAKLYTAPGAIRTLRSTVVKNEAAEQSGFLKERFSGNMYQKFNTKLIEQPEKFAGWLMTASDKIGTSFIWNSAYEKGLAQNVTDPIKYADDATRNLVAGRGIGEVPLLQKSKVFQFIAPFQLEVANLWKVQKDFVKEKDFGALVTLYLGAWMFNKAMEEVRGSKIVFDPIDAIYDAFTDKDISGWEKGGRLAGEVLSNIPLGQTAASFYPEYGTKNLPTREDFFGDRDPNRFGSGLLVAKGVQDPLFKILPPFGGAQIQKTLKGLDALKKEAVYNQDGDKLKYPVETDPLNALKGLMFGQGGFRETKDFYENERKPLGTKQTEEYLRNRDQGRGGEYYNQVMIYREISKIEKQIDAVRANSELSEEDKQNKIAELMEEMKKIRN